MSLPGQFFEISTVPLASAKYNSKRIVRFQEQGDKFVHRKDILF